MVLAAAGCELPGLSGEGTGYARFLGRARPREKIFCAPLSQTAPVDDGTDVRQPAPLFEKRTGPGSRATTHFLWPLFSQSRSPDERSFAFRPVFAVESRPGRKDVEVLWPLASYTRRGEDRTLKIRPLFLYKRRVRASGAGREVDTDWMLFPILFGGRDTREGSYFAIFPLGGTVKGQLGKKRISFFLWPLWMKTEDVRYRSASLLWPFMGYWKGEDQSGRRLWPFYSANRREGKFDRRTWLWPFIHSWKAGLDTKKPGEAFFFFPFFGRTRNYYKVGGERTLYKQQTTVLFPFFHHVKQTRPNDEIRSIRNLEEVQAPWPFLGYGRGEGLVARKLWPVWGERKSNDLRDKFVLWPLYRRSIRHEQDIERRVHNVAVILSSRLDRWVEGPGGRRYPPPWPDDFRRIPDPRIPLGLHRSYETRTGEVRSRRWAQLWPVFHYRRNGKTAVAFQMLSLLPRRAMGRAETLWRPFYTLYRYERDGTGQRRESALFGLIRHVRRREGLERPGMRHVNLLGVVNYHRRSGVGKRWSLLGGLVGYERVGDRRCYRFLWAPFGRIPPEVRERYERR